MCWPKNRKLNKYELKILHDRCGCQNYKEKHHCFELQYRMKRHITIGRKEYVKYSNAFYCRIALNFTIHIRLGVVCSIFNFKIFKTNTNILQDAIGSQMLHLLRIRSHLPMDIAQRLPFWRFFSTSCASSEALNLLRSKIALILRREMMVMIHICQDGRHAIHAGSVHCLAACRM